MFAREGCPYCAKAKSLLREKGAEFEEIDVEKTPEWTNLLYILAKGGSSGRRTVPEIFFNKQLIGGWEELEALESKGELDEAIQETLSAPTPDDFPPPLRKPKSEEYLEVIPKELREKWQGNMPQLHEKLGGSLSNPISSLLLMLETPDEMVVVCTAGPGSKIYTIAAGGNKGKQGSQEKLYCQVALEKEETLYIDDPALYPGLEENEDYVKFGYGYYVGAPWRCGQVKGTIVAMEKSPGILKPEHKSVIEEERDAIERDFKEYLASH